MNCHPSAEFVCEQVQESTAEFVCVQVQESTGITDELPSLCGVTKQEREPPPRHAESARLDALAHAYG